MHVDNYYADRTVGTARRDLGGRGRLSASAWLLEQDPATGPPVPL
jgi:hypothetical protein